MGSYRVAFLAGGLICVNGRLPMDLSCAYGLSLIDGAGVAPLAGFFGNAPIREALQEAATGLVG
ncbi:hypothetical protein CLV36_11028 [Laceyella sediminis]|uniref:Uncharacterized protein n=1 Tax=Laceyella sediminis TaxID=573074 RepID=A0ABX5EQ80_9BACL|nr:hypothetical protein [Laceyella sediminis]PRZ12981.1 hypothetical protein CLV36_11028 [Laceyella sediminis]